jgi:hypothetical protein
MRFALIGALTLIVAAGIGATTLSMLPRSDSEPLRPIQVTAPRESTAAPSAVSPTATPPAPRVTAPGVAADQRGVPPPPPPAHTKVPTVSPGIQSGGGGGTGGDDDGDGGDDDDDDG